MPMNHKRSKEIKSYYNLRFIVIPEMEFSYTYKQKQKNKT